MVKIRTFSMLLMESLDYSQDLPCWLFLSFARGETDMGSFKMWNRTTNTTFF